MNHNSFEVPLQEQSLTNLLKVPSQGESIQNSFKDPSSDQSIHNLCKDPPGDKSICNLLNTPSKKNRFLYVKESKRFEELEDGKVKCGICLKNFSRIISHLTNSITCRTHIDFNEFKLLWTKYLKKRKPLRQKKFEDKKRAQNAEQF